MEKAVPEEGCLPHASRMTKRRREKGGQSVVASPLVLPFSNRFLDQPHAYISLPSYCHCPDSTWYQRRRLLNLVVCVMQQCMILALQLMYCMHNLQSTHLHNSHSLLMLCRSRSLVSIGDARYPGGRKSLDRLSSGRLEVCIQHAGK
jgi:hypothetical protein